MKKHLSRKRWLSVFAIILGCVLIFLSNKANFSTSNEKESTSDICVSELEAQLSTQLSSFLEQMEGIDCVQVFLTLDCTTEQVYAVEEDQNGAQKYVVLNQNGKSEALAKKEIYAKVRGIAVLCVGGDLPQNQEKIIGLLTSAFHIPAHKIFVAESKKVA